MFAAGALENTYHLRRIGRINRSNFLFGPDHLVADDHVIFPAQFGPHFGQRIAHFAGIFRVGEVRQRFVAKRIIGNAESRPGSFKGSRHSESFESQLNILFYYLGSELALPLRLPELPQIGELWDLMRLPCVIARTVESLRFSIFCPRNPGNLGNWLSWVNAFSS
jgi:hypothetical protein